MGIIADVQNFYETENTTVENLYDSSLVAVIPAIGASCRNIYGSYKPETEASQDIYGKSDRETAIDIYGSDIEICEPAAEVQKGVSSIGTAIIVNQMPT